MTLPKILVVDDQLLNIRLLERKLERSEMQVLSCTNGPEALRLARAEKPDVVLLDIMMPGMDGIEVCRQLKDSEETREIPVIFITARTSKEDKLEGLDVGAADYLIKPIDMDETLARVRTQLRIIQEHRENIRLTRQLEQSRRQSSIMHLTEGIAHNLNNLLGVMVGYVSLLTRCADKPDKVLHNCERLDAAIKRMTRIVHQLTVIAHFKSLQTEPVAVSRILQGAVARFHRVASTNCPVRIDTSLPPAHTLTTNRELLEVCLERLLQNAWESYHAAEGEPPAGAVELVLAARVTEDGAAPQFVFEVLDRGKGIDPALRDSIFEPFVTSSSVVGRGMGLTIARHSVQCLGGTIELVDREGGGARAVITLPMNNLPVSES